MPPLAIGREDQMRSVGLPIDAEHVGVVGCHAHRRAAVDRGDEHIAERAADAADERDLPAVRRERGRRVADVRGRRVGQRRRVRRRRWSTISMWAGDASVAAPAVIASERAVGRPGHPELVRRRARHAARARGCRRLRRSGSCTRDRFDWTNASCVSSGDQTGACSRSRPASPAPAAHPAISLVKTCARPSAPRAT